MNRKSYWQKIYSSKQPSDLSWFQKEPEISLRLIRNTDIAKDKAIIDVGGGASVLVDRLYEEGFLHVAVLDISQKALFYAQKRLDKNAQAIEWYKADIVEFEAPHPFMLWHDRAVFHFLTEPKDRKRYVTVLKQTLLPQGHVIIATFSIGGPTRCSGLDIVQYDAVKLSKELGEEFQLIEEVGEVHKTPANREQKFSYFRFYRIGGRYNL